MLVLLLFLLFHGEGALVGAQGVQPAPSATPPQCLYAADLQLSSAGYVVTSYGRLLVWDGSGRSVANLTAVPTALALDRTQDVLYVAGLGSVQRLDIGGNLSQANSLCPCSLINDLTTIRSLVADERDGGLFVSLHQMICHFYPVAQIISGCDDFGGLLGSATLTHMVLDTDRNLLYGVPSDRLVIMVFSVVGTSQVQYLTTWTPLPPQHNQTYVGLAMGANGNLFANLTPLDDTVIVELDLNNNGSLVSRYVASEAEFAAIDDFYDLAYNNDTGRFYSFFTFRGSTPTIGSYQLVPSSSVNGTFNNSIITEFTPPGSGPASPLSMVWGRCPYLAAPSASPSPAVGGGGSDTKQDITISFSVAAPFIIIMMLICCCSPIVFVYVWRRRRRYYTGPPRGRRGTTDGDVEMTDLEGAAAASAFTYREIDFADLTLGRELGHGAFGRVYRGEYRGAVVAVKMFEGVRLDEAEEHTIRELRKEAEMLEKLSNHPCIVKFVGAITQARGGATTFALVTEYCCRGSLHDLLIRKNKKLPLITLVRMARDVATGILHLHKEHVMHRDIAARNILVGKNYEVYVADFGLARTKAVESRVATTKQSFGPIAWMAPEALGNLEYSEATDAYSFGVLLWEMMARKRPWAGVEGAHIVSSVTANARPQIPKDCDPMFRQIIKQCWKHNPSRRPSFEQIVKSLTAYHKNLKKVMSFTSDSVESSESENSATSEDELEAYDGEDGEDPRSRRMKGEIKTLLNQLLAERSDDGFEVIEKANLAALEDIKASLARLNSRGIETPSSAFPVVPVEPAESAIYVAATSDVISSGYAQVTPKLPRKNAKKKRRRQDDDGDDGDDGGVEDEWTVLEQPRRPTPLATTPNTGGTASKTEEASDETGDDGYVSVNSP